MTINIIYYKCRIICKEHDVKMWCYDMYMFIFICIFIPKQIINGVLSMLYNKCTVYLRKSFSALNRERFRKALMYRKITNSMLPAYK